jgi:hypothetical protein
MITISVVLSIHSKNGIATRSSVLVAETITELLTIPSLIPEPRAKRAVDPDPIPQQVSAPRPVTCCPPDCRGQVCSNSRSLMHKLATDLGELVHKLNDLTRTEPQVSSQVSGPIQIHTC